MISQARLFLKDTSENQLRNMPGQDENYKTSDRTGLGSLKLEIPAVETFGIQEVGKGGW